MLIPVFPISVNTISLKTLQALKNISAVFPSMEWDRQTNIFEISSGAVSQKEVMLTVHV